MAVKMQELIAAVYVRAPLWDQTNVKHHNRFVLDKLWDEVAEEQRVARKEVRKKWKNLRDKFRTELHKFPEFRSSESGNADTEPYSSWKYFHSLLFLKDQFAPKQNTEIENSKSASSTTDIFIDVKTEDLDNASLPQTPSDNTSLSKFFTESCENKRFYQTAFTQTRESDAEASLVELEQKKPKLLECDQPDEDQSFFSSLLPHVRKLDDEKKMLLRLEMQQLVYKYVYGDKTC